MKGKWERGFCMGKGKMASGHVGGGSTWKRGEGFGMIKHASGARAGYKTGIKLGAPGAGQWFCDFCFGPLVFF